MRTDTKTHTDISVIDNSTDITVYAPDPQIRQNYDAFVKYVRNLELKMRGYNTNEDAGPKPIASYRAAGKTNEDADRAVLKDLTGNGHDLQLKNFAWAEGSGYGLYQLNWASNKWIKFQDRADITYTDHSFNTSKIKDRSIQFYYQSIASESPFTIPSYIIRVSGLKDGQVLNYRISNPVNLFQISQDGVYTLPSFEFAAKGAFYGFQFNKPQESCNITIEQIPEYEGALVFDGVDDYAICENFPILTKEKGYGVVALRQWIEEKNDITALVSNSKNWNLDGAFMFEYNNLANNYPNLAISFGRNSLLNREKLPFTYQTSKLYNGKNINLGDFAGSNELIVGKANKSFSSCSKVAIWKLDIFDHDLTEEEIQKVKDQYKKEYPQLFIDEV